jgi:hypothetical protein
VDFGEFNLMLYHANIGIAIERALHDSPVHHPDERITGCARPLAIELKGHVDR